MRICIENGFHRSSRKLSLIQDQMRRRVFWACYISDRHSSSVLGRPMAIRDEDIDIEVRRISYPYPCFGTLSD